MSARAAALLLAGALWGCGAAPAPAAAAPAPPAPEPPAMELTERGLDAALGVLTDLMVSLRAAPYDDAAIQGYVGAVGRRVAANARLGREVRFVVVDDTQVQAWAMPGGHIEVARGLLAVLGSEAELAAVLAHEVAHQELRHGAHSFLRRVLEIDDATPLAQRYDQDKEHQADRRGLELLRAAGYEPQAMPRMFARLVAASVTSDDERAATWPRTARILRHAGGLRGGDEGAEEYRAHMENLVIGEDPRQGLLRARTFLCARDGFALDLPQGWEVSWQDRTLQARGPGGSPRLSLSYYHDARAPLPKALLQLAEAEPHTRTEALGWPMLERRTPQETHALWSVRGGLWALRLALPDPSETSPGPAPPRSCAGGGCLRFAVGEAAPSALPVLRALSASDPASSPARRGRKGL